MPFYFRKECLLNSGYLSLFACRESHFSAYLTLWFPLLIWWTPLCLIRQILTRRFRLYAYKQLVEILVLYNFKGTGPLRLICVFLTILKPRHTVPDVAPPKFPLFCSFVGQSFYCPRWQCKHPLVAEFQ